MRYEFDFILPDKSIITYTGQTCAQVVENIIELAKTHYDVDYKFTKHTLYNLTVRPEKAHSFYRQKVIVRKKIVNLNAIPATPTPE